MPTHSKEIQELAAKASSAGENDFAAALCFLGAIHCQDNPALMREVRDYLKSKWQPQESQPESWPDTIE